MVSDSSNGYVSKFKLYTGKSSKITGPSFNGATYDLVMDMMRGFFDNEQKVGDIPVSNSQF
jgi:hypothetical protein